MDIGNNDITFVTRGDDIDRLKEVISLVPRDNEILRSYLYYLKNEILDQINIDLPKQEYPIGHPKGFSEEEFEKYLDCQERLKNKI